MVKLNLALRLRDILQGHGIIDAVNGDDIFHGDTLPRQGKQEQHLAATLRAGEHRWWGQRHGHLSVSS